MATLTTVDGIQITFNSDDVAVITDHDPMTGDAITCVWGATHGMVKISETLDGFMARLGITAKLAKLTRPDGWPVWISGVSASSLRAPLRGEYPPEVHAVVVTGALTQGVTETPAAATAALDAHGGKL